MKSEGQKNDQNHSAAKSSSTPNQDTIISEFLILFISESSVDVMLIDESLSIYVFLFDRWQH